MSVYCPRKACLTQCLELFSEKLHIFGHIIKFIDSDFKSFSSLGNVSIKLNTLYKEIIRRYLNDVHYLSEHVYLEYNSCDEKWYVFLKRNFPTHDLVTPHRPRHMLATDALKINCGFVMTRGELLKINPTISSIVDAMID